MKYVFLLVITFFVVQVDAGLYEIQQARKAAFEGDLELLQELLSPMGGFTINTPIRSSRHWDSIDSHIILLLAARIGKKTGRFLECIEYIVKQKDTDLMVVDPCMKGTVVHWLIWQMIRLAHIRKDALVVLKLALEKQPLMLTIKDKNDNTPLMMVQARLDFIKKREQQSGRYCFSDVYEYLCNFACEEFGYINLKQALKEARKIIRQTQAKLSIDQNK